MLLLGLFDGMGWHRQTGAFAASSVEYLVLGGNVLVTAWRFLGVFSEIWVSPFCFLVIDHTIFSRHLG